MFQLSNTFNQPPLTRAFVLDNDLCFNRLGFVRFSDWHVQKHCPFTMWRFSRVAGRLSSSCVPRNHIIFPHSRFSLRWRYFRMRSGKNPRDEPSGALRPQALPLGLMESHAVIGAVVDVHLMGICRRLCQLRSTRAQCTLSAFNSSR